MENLVETHYFRDHSGRRIIVDSPAYRKGSAVFSPYLIEMVSEVGRQKLNNLLKISDDHKICLEIADTVIESDHYDSGLVPGFVDDIAVVLANIDVNCRNEYLERIKLHRENSIEEAIDFADDVKYAFVGLKGVKTNFKHSLDYATNGIEIEKRFGHADRSYYDQYVTALVANGRLSLGNAVDISSKIFKDGKLDFVNTGKIIGMAHGLKDSDDVNEYAQVYDAQVQRHDIVDATNILVPAYFSIFALAERHDVRLLPNFVVQFVDPAVEFFNSNPKYLGRDFGEVMIGSFASFYRGIAVNPKETFEFAGRLLNGRDAKYDTNRWVNCVENYINRGFSLNSAMNLSDTLESYAKNKGEYPSLTLNFCLELQNGAPESEKVGNAVKTLNESNVGALYYLGPKKVEVSTIRRDSSDDKIFLR